MRTFDEHTWGDSASAIIDVGSGNLLLTTTQLSLPRIAGSLPLGVTYNSLSLAAGSRFSGSVSPGWRFSTGSDVYLKSFINGWVTFYGPNGLTGAYQPTGTGGGYTSPSTIKSTLVHNADGSYDLTMHGSGDRYHFDSAGQLNELHGRSTGDASGTSPFTTFSYDGNGALTQIQTDKGTTRARTVTVTPAAYGGTRIEELTQAPAGATARTVTYSYDGSGRLSEITDTLGRHTDFGYSSAGDLTSVTAPSGAETDFAYNTARRVTSVTQPAAGGTTAVTRFTYNTDIGQTMVADPNTDQSQAVSAVPHTTYNLDSTGMLLVAQAIDPAGNTREATYNTFEDVESAQDSAGTSTFAYNDNGGESLSSATSPTATTGTTSGSFVYGNTGTSEFEPASGTDSQGNQTNYTYDGAGNTLSSSNATANTTASLTYNSDGTVATAVDPSSATTTYQYVQDSGDSTAQISTITPPTSGDNQLGVRTYTYDPFGRIKTYQSGRTTSSGDPITQTFSYDAGGRVTEIDYSDGTPSVNYTYTSAGQVHTRTDASGTTTYTYDPLGRLASRVSTAGGGTLTYSYDLDGNLVSETDGNGTTTDAYNDLDQLTSTTTPDGKTIDFNYDADGYRTDAWYATNSGNSSWAAHTHTVYDASHRITEVSTARASNDATLVSDLTYSYTAPTASACPTVQAAVSGKDSGLRWSQTNNVTGLTTSYCYDSSNRLTSATTPGGDSWAYTYDANGNRTQVTQNGATVQSFQPFDPGNQITTADGYDYDKAGNLTTAPGNLQLSYNGSDQLTGRSGLATGSYTYAGSTQTELTSQTVPGGATYTYTYGRTDQNGLPVLDTFTNPNGTNYLTHDNRGTPLAIKTYQGSYSYYVLDGLGSPIAMVNPSGTVQATYTYDPWGNVTVNNPTNSTVANLQPYRFAGGILDRSTNYVKYGMRYYDPATGRFTQQDSLEVIGDPSRGDRYEYAGDDPINLIDPTGQNLLDDILGEVSAVAGLVATGADALGLEPISFVAGGVAVASSVAKAGVDCFGGGTDSCSGSLASAFVTTATAGTAASLETGSTAQLTEDLLGNANDALGLSGYYG